MKPIGGGLTLLLATQVPEALAECVDLPDGARVVVRARSDVAVADAVILEPASEDDWEILELNANFLEEHLLTRVSSYCFLTSTYLMFLSAVRFVYVV